MNDIKISYLVTCCNETTTLEKLFDILNKNTSKDDQIVPFFDIVNGSEETKKIINEFVKNSLYTKERLDTLNMINVPFEKHYNKFNNDYSEHKNLALLLVKEMSNNQYRKSDFIFQIDADELPSDTLLLNIKEIIKSNPTTELFYVPRINDYKGVTQEHAKQWGWRLTSSPSCDNRLIVQWPDFQGRIFKNDYPRIKFERKLHEKIEGHKEYTFLPAEEELALYHDKSIETQILTNQKYNQLFSESDNKGHKVI